VPGEVSTSRRLFVGFSYFSFRYSIASVDAGAFDFGHYGDNQAVQEKIEKWQKR
jgi:hypothetical protein